MGTDYRCDSCGLTFTTGWDHYHRFTEFSAETKLVCAECGTCHVVRHAIDGKVPDALLAQPEPVFTATRSEVVMYGEWRRCDVTLDLRPVRKRHQSLRREGVTDPLNLDAVHCAHCHAKGTLTHRWPEGEKRCPHCQQPNLQIIGCWMT